MSATSDLKSFHYLENGEISFSILDTVKTVKKLDCGVYNMQVLQTNQGQKLEVKIIPDIETVKTYNFPDKEKLNDLFKAFFDKKVITKMRTLGFNHKVGVLLHGKEGTGKSTIIKTYYTQLINKHKCVVFYVNGHYGFNMMWDFVIKIRAVQNNPIVVVFEEMDNLIGHGYESELKKCFDGNESIDNCLLFGTTNYIDKIPDALKKRPSRFKYCLEIEGIDNEKDIYDILQNLIGDIFEPTEIVDFSRELVGSTLDVIKQFGFDKIMDLNSYSQKTHKKIGFNV